MGIGRHTEELSTSPPMMGPSARQWEEEEFLEVVARLKRENVIRASGVRISAKQMERLLHAAPNRSVRERPGWVNIESVDFEHSTFEGVVRFDQMAVGRQAIFRDATFLNDAYFTGSTFGYEADFSGAVFEGDAYFYAANFRFGVSFSSTEFKENSHFQRARFNQTADFSTAVFLAEANFVDAFFGIEQRGAANFDEVSFGGKVESRGLVANSKCSFRAARFERPTDLGPMLTDSLDMTDAIFAQPTKIRMGTREARFDRAEFKGGVNIFLGGASITLDSTDFGGPSLIAEEPLPKNQALMGHRAPTSDREEAACSLNATMPRDCTRVLSVRHSKVQQLTLSGLDLRACRFTGAHGLDGMRLEEVRFAGPPSGWFRSPPWRWTRRQTIAEEHHFRSVADGSRGWYGADVAPASWLGVTDPPSPGQIAVLYRSLRKSLEDNQDEPGAGDFYYGEMEMRRKRVDPAGVPMSETARTSPAAERWIIWLYWLVSGYGLRALRSLAALAALVLLAAFPLVWWGTEPPLSYGRAVLFAAESSISLLRAPEMKLTAGGQVIEIVLRVVGPVLFGLAALALRARVKR